MDSEAWCYLLVTTVSTHDDVLCCESEIHYMMVNKNTFSVFHCEL